MNNSEKNMQYEKSDSEYPYPCVGISHPFTEQGKPACLSKACPKDRECKVCCKDWRYQ